MQVLCANGSQGVCVIHARNRFSVSGVGHEWLASAARHVSVLWARRSGLLGCAAVGVEALPRMRRVLVFGSQLGRRVGVPLVGLGVSAWNCGFRLDMLCACVLFRPIPSAPGCGPVKPASGPSGPRSCTAGGSVCLGGGLWRVWSIWRSRDSTFGAFDCLPHAGHRFWRRAALWMVFVVATSPA